MRVKALLEEAVQKGVVPGVAFGVVFADGRREAFHLGLAQREPEPVPLEAGFYFDLASLTKPLFTLKEVLKAVEEGLLDLDDPLAQHLPEMLWLKDHPLKGVSVRALLAHTAGLPPWEALYTWGEGEALKARFLQHPWPLGEPAYSDIGYMLLGLLLERVRGRPLRDFPLPAGLTFAPPQERSVATERCPWRGRVLRGEVHDENAFALGGAAGHAGLFGTLEGVLGELGAILQGTWLSRAALEEMQRPHGERLLSWERKRPGWHGGSLVSERAFGHTGFTGVGVWVDPEWGYAWALLTNAVHPTRHRPSLVPLRRAVGNALAAEVV
ncbi:serine hydrolase domain-containing protein [Thermus caliditerrae]|uniref:serine hydrolase domain-containing protein n=1 Tax=Thermus caliditerrae TaxID=1330700 RepID=UPI001F419230|nr:serine hydrolase domain-containing protein [Thermus caliditerrae]